MGTSGIVLLIAVGGVVFVVGLMWFLRHVMEDLKEPVPSIQEHSPLGDRTAIGAESARFASRLPISLRRAKGDKSFVHEFVEASRIESKEAFGIGPSQEVATVYPEADLESHLDERSRDGWELFSMEPHWYYERQYISGAMSITRPLAIVGWYLTWLRSEARSPLAPGRLSQGGYC